MNWDKTAPQKWMTHIGVLGCETIIWWPDRGAASIVWSNLASKGDAAEWKASLGRAGQALASFKKTMESEGVSTIGLSGLVVQTGRCSGQAPSVDIESVNVSGACIVGVSFPQEIDQADVTQFARIVEDFHAAITMTIEHANG